MAYKQLSHNEIVSRERALVVAHGPDPITASRAIDRDRADRWKAHLAAMVLPKGLAEWAKDMATRYGPDGADLVQIHRSEVDFITALFIGRYGEAEYHWPLDLSEVREDPKPEGRLLLERAAAWASRTRPDVPGGVRYLNGSITPAARRFGSATLSEE